MKKLSIVFMVAVLSLFLMAGCSEEKKDDITANTAPDSSYAEYDGYIHRLDNGDLKYQLDTSGDFRMHCFFQYDSPEYQEDIYTITLDDSEPYTMTATKIVDGSGNDITGNFKSLTYTIADGELRMDVVRDESTLAGGESSSIMSGSYVFTPPSGTSSTDSSSKYNEKIYTSDELGKLAQSYYKKQNGYCPPESAVTKNSDGTFTIQLYEKVDNGDGSYHTSTSAWYTVDQLGRGKNDITEESVDLNQ